MFQLLSGSLHPCHLGIQFWLLSNVQNVHVIIIAFAGCELSPDEEPWGKKEPWEPSGTRGTRGTKATKGTKGNHGHLRNHVVLKPPFILL